MRTSEQIKVEIAQKFGFIPPFYKSTQPSPQVLENLWQQTLLAYVDNPLPTIFKEKLSAYLSRYCAVPYCMICHSCSLYGMGVQAQEILQLLASAPPTAAEIKAHLGVLRRFGGTASIALQELDPALEESLLWCAIAVALDGNQTECRKLLSEFLGTEGYQHLITLIAYIKTCSVWMEAHPQVSCQADKRVQDHLERLLAAAPELAEFFDNHSHKVKAEGLRETPTQVKLPPQGHSSPTSPQAESPLTFEAALKLVNDQLFAKFGRFLKDPEKIVLGAAWEDKGYEEVAEPAYSAEHLRCYVGRSLWLMLTPVLGNGEKVTKKRFRRILEQRLISQPEMTRTVTFADRNQSLSILGGQLPDISPFFGRCNQLNSLSEAIKHHQCVALVGAQGIGKSALVAKLIEQINSAPHPEFECVVWKSLSQVPRFEDLATELLSLLNPEAVPASCQAKSAALIDVMKTHRCLLVLDGLETVLRANRSQGFDAYGEGYADYGVFLQGVLAESHQSCLLFTSQEPVPDQDRIQVGGLSFANLSLAGVDVESASKILAHKGLQDPQTWPRLIQMYEGNPLALSLIASRIKDYFGGKVSGFFNDGQTSVMTDLFEKELYEWLGPEGRLTRLEKQLVVYLAETLVKERRESLSATKILEAFKAREPSVSLSAIMGALSALTVRSLVIKESGDKSEAQFSLRNIVKCYAFKNRTVIA